MVGLILGLIGSGGSILSVPILVYLFGINPVTATAYSLFIVGTTSLIGSIKNLRDKLINYSSTLLFSFSAVITGKICSIKIKNGRIKVFNILKIGTANKAICNENFVPRALGKTSPIKTTKT